VVVVVDMTEVEVEVELAIAESLGEAGCWLGWAVK
jgi:hypothetical protein